MTKQTRNIIKWNIEDEATSRRSPRGDKGAFA
jgi:hypothetical protein